MKKIRIPVIFHDGVWTTAFPNFQMVGGSWLGADPTEGHADGVHPTTKYSDALAAKLSCEIWVPDGYVKPDGSVDAGAVTKDAASTPNSGLVLPEHLVIVNIAKV